MLWDYILDLLCSVCMIFWIFVCISGTFLCNVIQIYIGKPFCTADFLIQNLLNKKHPKNSFVANRTPRTLATRGCLPLGLCLHVWWDVVLPVRARLWGKSSSLIGTLAAHSSLQSVWALYLASTRTTRSPATRGYLPLGLRFCMRWIFVLLRFLFACHSLWDAARLTLRHWPQRADSDFLWAFDRMQKRAGPIQLFGIYLRKKHIVFVSVSLLNRNFVVVYWVGPNMKS